VFFEWRKFVLKKKVLKKKKKVWKKKFLTLFFSLLKIAVYNKRDQGVGRVRSVNFDDLRQ